MMKALKKTVKLIFYPHFAVLFLLLPASAAVMSHAFARLDPNSPTAVFSYFLSAYTLAVLCLRIPAVIEFFRKLGTENPFVVRFRTDVRFRVNISLFFTFAGNTAYAVFQLWLGVYHMAMWYFTSAGYYFLLAGMRYFLVRFSSKNEPGERMREELVRYRLCGWVFLLMNLSLAVMIALNVWKAGEVHHHQITAFAMAAYTVTSFTVAVINLFRYRKYNSPVFMASKSISFASASVSMLTLTSTLLTAFGNGDGNEIVLRRVLLGSIGGAVSLLFISMSIYMVVNGTKKLREETK